MSRITGEPSIETLLTIGENIVIEFKRAGDGPKHDTYESICAFLNRNGGDVLLGVTDDGEVVGVPPKSARARSRSFARTTRLSARRPASCSLLISSAATKGRRYDNG